MERLELQSEDWSDSMVKVEAEWNEGLWHGHVRSFNEIFLGTKDGLVRAWSKRKKPVQEQQDAGLIK